MYNLPKPSNSNSKIDFSEKFNSIMFKILGKTYE